MPSLSKMKVQLAELEDQKHMFEAGIINTSRRLKISLWVMGAGVLLIPLYGVGLLALLAGGIVALVNLFKRSRYQEEIEHLEDSIHKLEISMA
jgi:hypothetical protein